MSHGALDKEVTGPSELSTPILTNTHLLSILFLNCLFI